MTNRLLTVSDAAAAIESGRVLLLAGDASALQQLPRGNWIGGTIPYFMTEEGGCHETERVYVTELPVAPDACRFVTYDANTISSVVTDADTGVLTFLILPGFSAVHEAYAKGAPDFPGMYMRPLVGWISGVSLDRLGEETPQTFLGPSATASPALAVAVHAPLPEGTDAHIDILNLFTPGEGPVLSFPETSFAVSDCYVDGKAVNLAQWITQQGVDTRLPLVADYCGAMINTSFAGVDPEAGEVKFYAPVFPGVEYRLATPVTNYAQEFTRHVQSDLKPVFACNCILNYLYGELEGRQLPGPTGPVTFGEVAYQLLNQTMVYVNFDQAA